MILKKYNKLLLFLLFSIFPILLSAQSTTIRGLVRDSISHEPLSYASVFLLGTDKGTRTDADGNFSITVREPVSQIRISTLGYVETIIAVKSQDVNELVVDLRPSTYELSEVTVKPKREKYSRKNNPAVDFANKLIKRKKVGDPRENDFYNYETYEKMTFALNDFSEEQKEKWLYRKFQFIFNYVDTSEVSGKPILTVSVKERLSETHYRKDPESEKVIVSGIRREGIDELVDQESLQAFISDVMREIDIFGGDIPLLQQRFVSPLSTIAPTFYKFYLLDTIPVLGERCIDLAFTPFNSESAGFTGHIYVPENDTTYFIKRVKLSVPKDINVNYVDQIYVEQDFVRDAAGNRQKVKDDMIVEFSLTSFTQGLYARKINTYSNFSYTEPEDSEVFKIGGSEFVKEEALMQPEAFWKDNRHMPIKEKENAVKQMLEQLRQNKAFYYTEKVIGALIAGYIPSSKENSKFDFGPMNTTLSGGDIEGLRMRVGGMTTANLNPHLFARGYVAYGTKDGRFKYSIDGEYSFNKKKYHPREFPVHSIRLRYSYDLDELGQHYLYTNKDNVFLSLKRRYHTKATYLRKAEFNYQNELRCGFSYNLGFRHEIQTGNAGKVIRFNRELQQSFGDATQTTFIHTKDFKQAYIDLNLRYAHNEKFYQTKSDRIPINLDAPVFTLRHSFGFKGFLGSRCDYNFTEIGVQKRFWFSAFGYLDMIVRAGKVWNEGVPFTMLCVPNANMSFTIQPESYALMNSMEFINDQYVSWDFVYNANGIILNRIPLIRYLKWREVFAFRGLYGTLKPGNNPAISDNPALFDFPAGCKPMKNMPYMEASVGLDNIFTILRVDYVFRLSYFNQGPGCPNHGPRIALHFSF